MKNGCAAKQGKCCRGICDGYRLKILSKGEKKYINNVRCTYCDKWMPKSMVVMVGIYHRCPCCNMRVRTKRQSSLSPSEKHKSAPHI